MILLLLLLLVGVVLIYFYIALAVIVGAVLVVWLFGITVKWLWQWSNGTLPPKQENPRVVATRIKSEIAVAQRTKPWGKYQYLDGYRTDEGRSMFIQTHGSLRKPPSHRKPKARR